MSGRYRTVTSNECMRFDEFWPPDFSLLMLQVGWLTQVGHSTIYNTVQYNKLQSEFVFFFR